MKKILAPLISIIVLGGLFTSCVSHQPMAPAQEKPNDDTVVYIKAINDGKTTFEKIPKQFTIVPYDDKTDKNDLYFKRVAGMIERTLNEKGFIALEKPNKKTIRIKARWSMASSTHYVFGKNTRYQRFIDLKAVDSMDKVLWQISIDSTGTSRRLVKIIPRMLAASVNYIGATFEGNKKQTITNEESDLVRKIRGPLVKDSTGEVEKEEKTDSAAE